MNAATEPAFEPASAHFAVLASRPQGTSHTPGATIRSHCSDDALADDARRFQHIDPIQLIIVAQAYQRMLHDDLRSDLPCPALPENSHYPARTVPDF